MLNKILRLLLCCVFLIFINSSTVSEVMAQNSASGNITSPEMKSPNKYPAYNDTYFTYYSDIIGYKSNGLWGFYGASNRSVNIPAIYSDIEGLDEQFIKVKYNGRWGLIKSNGDQILGTDYDSIESTSIGWLTSYFKVSKNGKYGIIDSNRQEVVPLIYQDVSKFNDSYLKIKSDYMYGVYSINGKKEIISPKYEEISMMSSWFKVRQQGRWGLIDYNDNLIIPFKYGDIKTLNNSFFGVKLGNVWGTVDAKTGNEVISPAYDKIEYAKMNYFKVKQNGKWGVVTYEGKLVVPITKGPFEINKEVKNLR